MVSLLLPVIYLAFISLGLPDALLGAAWPSMYPQLGAGVSWAGCVSMIISVGTIVSSLASDWLNNKLGTGRVTALSVATTAVALFGFSTCTQFWQLCLWAMPYGLGAGSVDAALNNYVALHYESRHMSWLHCRWGLGAVTAASWASLFYAGITIGRFLSGFLTMKFNDHQMIRLGQALIAVGIALVLLPGNALLLVGLVTIGLGCAPIYPSIIHETPANFGKSLSMAMTGVQMAAAYTGTTLLSPLFGVLAQNITMQLYPLFLLLMLVLMAVLSEQLHKKTAARRVENS